jgi:pyruvate/2-oxoglutarate dehydrogenase complex dihydrolipoamide dehydrogenase (E3) component
MDWRLLPKYCLPAYQNLIHSAKVASFAKRSEEFGLDGGPLVTNMPGVLRRKRAMVADLLQVHLDRFESSGAELILGQGAFIGERTIEVTLNSGEVRVVTADRVFVNIGSRSAVPDIPGLALAKPLTHVELLELDRVPEHLLVLGAGYIGLEMAQAMRRFGSRVTVIERGPQLVGKEDPEIGTALFDLFRDEGIEVLLGSTVVTVSGQSGQQVHLTVSGSSGTRDIEATDILIASGRTPNTAGAGLDRAGIELDARGYIKVNERLETTAYNIWAMGDCAGSPQFTHVAFDDFRIVSENQKGGNRTTKQRLIPFCMFTDPELVRVGLNEREAAARGIDYRLFRLPMSAVLRTRTVSEPRGFMKMLVAMDSDQILGFTAFGFEASELLAAVQTAMLAKMPYSVLRDAIYTHPTIAEGLVFLLLSTPFTVRTKFIRASLGLDDRVVF